MRRKIRRIIQHAWFADLRVALNEGTTMPTRYFVSVAAMLEGGGYMLKSPGWLSHPVYDGLNAVVDIRWWGVAYMLAGLGMFWRVVSPASRPLTAWAVNIYAALIWSTGMCTRMMIGAESVLSTYTALTIAVWWLLLRTEATSRDTRVA